MQRFGRGFSQSVAQCLPQHALIWVSLGDFCRVENGSGKKPDKLFRLAGVILSPTLRTHKIGQAMAEPIGGIRMLLPQKRQTLLRFSILKKHPHIVLTTACRQQGKFCARFQGFAMLIQPTPRLVIQACGLGCLVSVGLGKTVQPLRPTRRTGMQFCHICQPTF